MNKTSEYELTIIVPVYNEADNMEQIEKRLGAFLPHSLKRACVLMVDDGSTDDSLSLMRGICSRNRDFYHISFSRNNGLSAAMKAGIDFACSEWVGYIDADLQTDPEDFNLLLAKAGEYDMVTGKPKGFRLQEASVEDCQRFPP